VLAYRQPDKGPDVTVLFRTQVRGDKALRAVVEQQLDGAGAVVHRRDANGKTTWTGTAFDREVEITLSAQVLDGRLGPALTDPVRGDLRPALRARSEPEAWSAGHLTVGLDLGSFQQQLLKGAPPGLRELAEGFLTESLALGGGYLDLAPVTGGARLRGRIDVLPRKVR